MTLESGPLSSPDGDSTSVEGRVIRRNRSVVVALTALAAFGVGIAGCGDSPEEVSIDDAAKAASEAATSTSAGSDTTAEASSTESLVGTWDIDHDSGDFDFEEATGTFAGFRVSEELAGVGATEAVGRTGEVTGEVVLDEAGLKSARITVNLASITTNESRRDDKAKAALDTATYPDAEFASTGAVQVDLGVEEKTTVKIDVPGELTIKGVTKDVTFPLEAQRVGDSLVVVGSLDIVLSDYGVTAPTAPIVLSVSDDATIEFQLLLLRA